MVRTIFNCFYFDPIHGCNRKEDTVESILLGTKELLERENLFLIHSA
jgi:hypothetical protein